MKGLVSADDPTESHWQARGEVGQPDPSLSGHIRSQRLTNHQLSSPQHPPLVEWGAERIDNECTDEWGPRDGTATEQSPETRFSHQLCHYPQELPPLRVSGALDQHLKERRPAVFLNGPFCLSEGLHDFGFPKGPDGRLGTMESSMAHSPSHIPAVVWVTNNVSQPINKHWAGEFVGEKQKMMPTQFLFNDLRGKSMSERFNRARALRRRPRGWNQDEPKAVFSSTELKQMRSSWQRRLLGKSQPSVLG
ncbi:hypothetical protein ACRRTK_010920 [Alexandromys fortis]